MNTLRNVLPASQAIYLAKDVRRIEQRAAALPERPRLMERAGLAAAEQVREMLGDRGKSVLIVAGPGNNGGDAFEVATHLKRWFYGVQIVFLGKAAKLSADATRALMRWRAAGGRELSGLPSPAHITRDFDLVVDGLFGIGLARSLSGAYGEAVDAINQSGVPVLALDVPSGLNADTGTILGRAIRATRTVTFIALKPGLLTLDGPDYCGEVMVEPLALDVPALLPPQGRLLGVEALRDVLAPRPKNFHKGNAGDVAILGGASGMVGAALLAGRAALATGAGRVHVGLLDDEGPRVDFERLELMLRRARDLSMSGP
jgi:ADP-dependent NAD(P)H-hydrate dehydratase / NAD(P)H-hydrate epimerase